ncbi:AMP-binding protein [Nocardiopsis sp. CNT-189]|uniref:AMP-binding protein n=1 Tax=Nocardiopsis oceanisediminis TaxID=2816862 RepID=UPI003B36264B
MPTPAQQVTDWLATYDTPDSSVAHLLCDRHPREAPALTEIAPDLTPTHLTYGDLADRSTRLAAGLAQAGITAGDRVATLLGRGADLVATALAIWRLGAVHVPLFTALAPTAVRHRLTGSRTLLVVCDEQQRHKLDPAPGETAPWQVATTGEHPARPGDHTLALLADAPGPAPATAALGGAAPFLHLFTPGPTGRHHGFDVPVRALAAFHAHHHYGLDVTDDDVYWNTHDPSWTYGLFYGLITPLLAGQRTLQLRAGFDPELTLDVLGMHGVTNLSAAPTVYRTLRATVKTPPPEISLRCLSSAGEPLPPDVADWADDVFGIPVHDHHNQAELGACVGRHQHPDVAPEPRAASIGTPLPGWSLTVLDPLDDAEAMPGARGRVAVDTKASPLFWFEGYEDGEGFTGPRFTPDGRWFLTGVTGTRDREGHFYFSDRDDEAIASGGYRIVPGDVETALQEHPGVVEAAVYGAPDELAGQAVAASVVLAEGYGGGEELAEELRELVRTRFAEHAYPRVVEFVAELPKSPSGKIRRSRLRARGGRS